MSVFKYFEILETSRPKYLHLFGLTFSTDEILKNSPDKLEGYFAVPKVVE